VKEKGRPPAGERSDLGAKSWGGGRGSQFGTGVDAVTSEPKNQERDLNGKFFFGYRQKRREKKGCG